MAPRLRLFRGLPPLPGAASGGGVRLAPRALARKSSGPPAASSRGGLTGTAASASPLHGREQAQENRWAAEQDGRLTAALLAKQKAAAPAPGAAPRAAPADGDAAARVALEKIVPRATAAVKDKLVEWRVRLF